MDQSADTPTAKKVGTITRLMNMADLFEPKNMAENFQTSETKGLPYSKISRGDDVSVALFDETNVDKNVPKMTFKSQYQKRGFWGPKKEILEKEFDLEDWLNDRRMEGLVVLRREDDKVAKLVLESYNHNLSADKTHIMWSVTKSLVSAAVGIAVDSGKIDINKKVGHYVNSLKKSAYADATIKDVLTMSSGVKFDENYFSPFSDINRLKYVLGLGWSMDEFVKKMKKKRRNGPGKYRQYCSIDTHVLSMVVRECTGKSFSQYLQESIWCKVGFEADAMMLQDNEKNKTDLAFGCLIAKTRDLARFGWLYANDGRSPSTGHQVVSKEWVHASTTVNSKDDHLMPDSEKTNEPYWGYGYQWWLPHDQNDKTELSGEYMGIGVYNQFLYISKDRKTIIAMNCAYANYDKDQMSKSGDNWSEIQAVQACRAIAQYYAKK